MRDVRARGASGGVRFPRAVLYGLAVADAMGVPYEFRARGSFEATPRMGGFGTHHQPRGTFSDDTSMMLATCASLVATGGVLDEADLMRRFRSWRDDGEYTPDGRCFDIGGTCDYAISLGHCDPDSEHQGNGSLMRIAPMAFATTDSYRDCVLAAINLGSDTDTTAAVAGGLAGAAYGFDAIPADWVRDMRAKELIDRYL